MRAHTNGFKNAIKQFGKEISVKVIYTSNNQTITLDDDDLNSVSYHYSGDILKSIMKQLDIDSNTDIALNTIVNFQFGVKVGNSYEYLDYGNFIVYKSEKQEDTNSYKITCYDKLLYSMINYETPKISGTAITYPITVRNYISAICSHLGLTFANSSDTFVNYDKTIPSELYIDSDGNSLGYTFRDILDELAEVTASIICINDNDELEIRYINTTNDTIDEEYLKDINVNFGEQYGPINTVVLSRSEGTDKISLSEPENLSDTSKIAIIIGDNQIMNDDNRSDFMAGILNQLYGLQYYINDYSSPGIGYYELGDKYNVNIGNESYSCIMLNDEINITQGLEELIHTNMPEQAEVDYTQTDKTDRKLNRTSFIVDKVNQQVSSLITKVEKVGEDYIFGSSDTGSLTLQNINASEPIELRVYPTTESISYLYPRNGLYPSDTLYLTNRRIRFNNTSTNEIFDYELPDDLLYYDDDTYDEFYLNYDNQICRVIKKCGYNADGSVKALEDELTLNFTYPNIDLTTGNYQISILGYSSGYIYAKMLIFNQISTKSETTSEILQKANEINLSVNQKLTNYSTTTEMNAAINAKANEINIGVSETLEDYSTTSQMNAAINVKANEINQTVSGKVGKNEVISSINQTAEAVTINASKINLNGAITNNNGFSVSNTGYVTMNGATVNGGAINLNDNDGTNDVLKIESTNTYAFYRSNYIGLADRNQRTYLSIFMAEGYNGVLDMGNNATGNSIFLDVNGTSTFSKNLRINGNLTVVGTKNRVVEIKDGTKVYLNAYETPVPYFGDIGSNKTNENGYCKISIDNIFWQTIENDDYKVFIQECGNGILYVKKYDNYFEVLGTPNIEFDYEIKAIQKGYKNTRF